MEGARFTTLRDACSAEHGWSRTKSTRAIRGFLEFAETATDPLAGIDLVPSPVIDAVWRTFQADRRRYALWLAESGMRLFRPPGTAPVTETTRRAEYATSARAVAIHMRTFPALDTFVWPDVDLRRLPGVLLITYKTLTGKQPTLPLLPGDVIGMMLQIAEGIPTDQQRLIRAGQEISPDATVAELDLT